MSIDATLEAGIPSSEAMTLDAGTPAGSRWSNGVVLWVYSATIFLSAFLLFLVQPMFSKMVLPLLGGTPAVWNTCMLFFQAALLGGYLYAHLGSRWLGVGRHSVVHLVLLAVAAATLPIALPQGWGPGATDSPVPWLLGVLAVSLGLPFFAISASGPLLQKWFSETGHPDAGNPYFLYAASNVGSLLALLGYPFLMEPRLRLAEQSYWWSIGYGALLVLFIGCAFLVYRSSLRRPSSHAGLQEGVTPEAREPAPTSGRRAFWVLLAFIPSSLLLGVTGFLTTDVAAVPLLWILPLALYLLTFVLVFARKQLIPHSLLAWAQPFLALLLLLTIAWGTTGPATLLYPLHLVAFFVLAMVAHGELVRRRPGAVHLTEFYLWMSVGGVLGGIFNVLVAPNIFNSMLEYPVVIALACVLRPALAARDGLTKAGKRSLALVGGLFVGVLLAGLVVFSDIPDFYERMLPAVAVLASVAVVRDRRLFAVGAATLVILVYARSAWFSNTLYDERTFFAVHRVLKDRTGNYLLYNHGTTVHGVQSLDPERRTERIGYYSEAGPVGQLILHLPEKESGRNVGVVGLGTGAMACHAEQGDIWTFYEIDSAVERIARDPRFFSFLAECTPDARIVLGDARITLGDAPAGEYDLIFLDAFTSDAIPAHLLTRESLALYLSKLSQGGTLVYNISNRHLDLEPMLARLASDAGLEAVIGEHAPTPDEASNLIFPSRWVAMARSTDDLGTLLSSPIWREAVEKPGVDLWTDDFSNILSVLVWR